jgi:hypothetical protein
MASAVVSIAHGHEQIKEKSEPSYPRQNYWNGLWNEKHSESRGDSREKASQFRDSNQGYEMKLRSSVYAF